MPDQSSAYGSDFNQLDRNAWMFNTAKHRERMLMFNTRGAYDNNMAGDYKLASNPWISDIGPGRRTGGGRSAFGPIGNVGLRQNFNRRHPGNPEVDSLRSGIDTAANIAGMAAGAVSASRNYAYDLKMRDLKQNALQSAVEGQNPNSNAVFNMRTYKPVQGSLTGGADTSPTGAQYARSAVGSSSFTSPAGSRTLQRPSKAPILPPPPSPAGGPSPTPAPPNIQGVQGSLFPSAPGPSSPYTPPPVAPVQGVLPLTYASQQPQQPWSVNLPPLKKEREKALSAPPPRYPRAYRAPGSSMSSNVPADWDTLYQQGTASQIARGKRNIGF